MLFALYAVLLSDAWVVSELARVRTRTRRMAREVRSFRLVFNWYCARRSSGLLRKAIPREGPAEYEEEEGGGR